MPSVEKISKVAGFYNESFIQEAQIGLAETFGLNIGSPYIVMSILFMVNSTIGLIAGFAAIGEESGFSFFIIYPESIHPVPQGIGIDPEDLCSSA